MTSLLSHFQRAFMLLNRQTRLTKFWTLFVTPSPSFFKATDALSTSLLRHPYSPATLWLWDTLIPPYLCLYDWKSYLLFIRIFPSSIVESLFCKMSLLSRSQAHIQKQKSNWRHRLILWKIKRLFKTTSQRVFNVREISRSTPVTPRHSLANITDGLERNP